MIRNILLILSVLSIPNLALSQGKNKIMLNNVKMSVINNKIIINYDIQNSLPDSLHSIGLSFISSDNNIILPENLSGDIGNGITGDEGKLIRWDITKEFDNLNYGLKPYMYLDGSSTLKIPKGGPEKMFLSVLVPGLGDYFVANTREMKFKPYLRFASVAGFMILGYTSGDYRWTDYNESTILRRTYEYNEGWVTHQEKVLLAGDTHYKYFRHDAEIFYTLGAAIWIADIFWVLNKGYNNKLLNTSMQNSNISISPTPGGAALTLTF